MNNSKILIPLVESMNLYPSITVVDYTFDKYPRIWFHTDSLEELPSLLYYFKGCHCGYYGWSIEVYTDCAMSEPKFMVTSTNNDPEQISKEVNTISSLLTDHINDLKKRAQLLTSLLNNKLKEVDDEIMNELDKKNIQFPYDPYPHILKRK